MRTLKTDENNDLQFGENGDLLFVEDAEAVMQLCKHYALALKGEMVTKMDKGMPYFQSVFGREPDLQIFEAWFRRRMSEIAQVVSVTKFEALLINGTLSYSAHIETIYGRNSLNGEIQVSQ